LKVSRTVLVALVLLVGGCAPDARPVASENGTAAGPSAAVTTPPPSAEPKPSASPEREVTLPPSPNRREKAAYERVVKAEKARDQARDRAVDVVAKFPPPSPPAPVSAPPSAGIGDGGDGPPPIVEAPPPPVPPAVEQAIDQYKAAQDTADGLCSGPPPTKGPFGIAPNGNPLCQKKDKKLPAALLPWLAPLGYTVADFE
jgi:hypothetical protein